MRGPSMGRMVFVPEGQADRSLARSAWESVPQKEPSRRVRYDLAQLIPPCILGIISILLSDTAFEFASLQSSNRCAHPRNHTVPDGTAILGVGQSQALRARLRSHRPLSVANVLEEMMHGRG